MRDKQKKKEIMGKSHLDSSDVNFGEKQETEDVKSNDDFSKILFSLQLIS